MQDCKTSLREGSRSRPPVWAKRDVAADVVSGWSRGRRVNKGQIGSGGGGHWLLVVRSPAGDCLPSGVELETKHKRSKEGRSGGGLIERSSRKIENFRAGETFFASDGKSLRLKTNCYKDRSWDALNNLLEKRTVAIYQLQIVRKELKSSFFFQRK